MAQAYHLYAPLGGGTGLGLTLDIALQNDSGLIFDNSILCLSPSIHQSPVRAVVLMVGVCLHTHMYSDYFMEIFDYIAIRLSRFFLKVTFDFLFLSS